MTAVGGGCGALLCDNWVPRVSVWVGCDLDCSSGM